MVEDGVIEDVPDATGNGGVREDKTQFVNVTVHLTYVALVVSLAALVIDDEQSAVGAAYDAVRPQILDAVLVPKRSGCRCDGPLTINLVIGVEPSGDRAAQVKNGTADVSLDIL